MRFSFRARAKLARAMLAYAAAYIIYLYHCVRASRWPRRYFSIRYCRHLLSTYFRRSRSYLFHEHLYVTPRAIQPVMPLCLLLTADEAILIPILLADRLILLIAACNELPCAQNFSRFLSFLYAL